LNRSAVKGWFAQQSDTVQQAKALETGWNNYAGYLMLGAAVGLSILIIIRMLQGIKIEKQLRAGKIGG
jgi:predicted lipid-binding transport protein (Tim44 family)